ncbi:MAG: hypothetical protein Q7S39_02185, partial [Ignavibacteria bacterium]|nr:hypothetical protein [Ignavibacteria bacterium]
PVVRLTKKRHCHFDRREKSLNSTRFLSRGLLRNDIYLLFGQQQIKLLSQAEACGYHQYFYFHTVSLARG